MSPAASEEVTEVATGGQDVPQVMEQIGEQSVQVPAEYVCEQPNSVQNSEMPTSHVKPNSSRDFLKKLQANQRKEEHASKTKQSLKLARKQSQDQNRESNLQLSGSSSSQGILGARGEVLRSTQKVNKAPDETELGHSAKEIQRDRESPQCPEEERSPGLKLKKNIGFKA